MRKKSIVDIWINNDLLREEPLMLDIESIKANWENAVIVASRNHSIGPIVMESLDDVPVLIAELERLQAQAMAWEKACAILDGKSAPGI
jgi:hypothetical protein